MSLQREFLARTIAITFLLPLLLAYPALASTGTIDPVSHYAWNDNGGWVNWDPTDGNVVVSDTGLSGYIWSADFGWINLSPSLGGVTNDGRGDLGGYAWGQNSGWISFTGVTIDSGGVFHGSTITQSVFGTMTFDCGNCSVVTSWRPAVATSGTTNTGGGGTLSGPFSYGYANGSSTPQSGQGAVAGKARGARQRSQATRLLRRRHQRSRRNQRHRRSTRRFRRPRLSQRAHHLHPRRAVRTQISSQSPKPRQTRRPPNRLQRDSVASEQRLSARNSTILTGSRSDGRAACFYVQWLLLLLVVRNR
jgi:hypothetical protein